MQYRTEVTRVRETRKRGYIVRECRGVGQWDNRYRVQMICGRRRCQQEERWARAVIYTGRYFFACGPLDPAVFSHRPKGWYEIESRVKRRR